MDSQNSAGVGNQQMERINFKQEDDMVEDIFMKEDTDKDGFISKDEFSGPKEDLSRHDHDEL